MLVEPFAAALHAVNTVAPRDGERIAVLGPRRLGMLLVAALAGVRARMRGVGKDFAIVALARDPALLPLAREFGATEAQVIDDRGTAFAEGAFDVVFDTTGNPDALALATRLARREVHLKSTHGRSSCGLSHLTELVVDELAIERFPDVAAGHGMSAWERLHEGAMPRVAWLAAASPPAWLTATAAVMRGDAATLAMHYDGITDGLPRADVAVVDSAAQVDAVIRPRKGREEALIRPRGSVLVHASAATQDSPLLAAVVARSLRLTSSRCGDLSGSPTGTK